MTTLPTGRVEAGNRLVLDRMFPASVPTVWAAVSGLHRLARPLGDASADPRTVDAVAAEPVPAEPVLIRRYDPPYHLAVTLAGDGGEWAVDLDLEELDGVTVLRLTQYLTPGIDLVSVGPGWEYYLDRLVAVETGRDPGEVDFARDYYPAMAEYYRTLGRRLRFPVDGPPLP